MKRFNKCVLYVMSFTVLSISLSGILSDDSLAASPPYDTALSFGEPLVLTDSTCTGLENDISYSWYDDTTTIENWQPSSIHTKVQQYIDDIEYNLGTGYGWAVGLYPQSVHYGTGDKVRIYTFDNTTAYVDETDGRIKGFTNLKYVEIFQHSYYGCDKFRLQGGNYSSATYISPSQEHIYFINADITYPAGYDGEIIPDTAPVPSEDIDWTPDIALSQKGKWTVNVSDLNFWSIDEVKPFECDDEFPPMITWTFSDITDPENPEILEFFNATSVSQLTWETPKHNETRDYRLTGYYFDCEGKTFTETSSLSFVMGKDGNIVYEDLTLTCVTEDFPYVDIEGCWTSIDEFIAILTFQTPDVESVAEGSLTNLATGCRTLAVLDNWIGSPDVEICPQFPQDIRNKVTPFITFMFGLLTITFISRRQSIRSIS